MSAATLAHSPNKHKQCKSTMMMEEEMQVDKEADNSSKRPADGSIPHEEEAMPAAKRARLPADASWRDSDASNFLPTDDRSIHGRKKRFLQMHLQLLQALYQPVKTTSEENETDLCEDGSVQEDVWGRVSEFIQNRSNVQSLDLKVKHYESLLDEALSLEEESEQQINNTMMPWMLTPGISNGHRSNSLYRSPGAFGNLFGFGNSGPSGHHSLPFSATKHSPFAFGVGRLYPGARYPTNPADMETGIPNACAFLASFFEERYGTVMKDFKEATSPFQPLLKDVKERILSIEEKLEIVHRQSNPTTAVAEDVGCQEDHVGDSTGDDSGRGKDVTSKEKDDDLEEMETRLQTKLRLWKILESDLVDTNDIKTFS